MERLPLTISSMRLTGTRRSRARRLIVMLRSCISSNRNSPGWTGAMRLRAIFVLLIMVVHDFHGLGSLVVPQEADPPLCIDSDAELPLTVTLQGLQMVGPYRREVGQASNSV